ncbi:MAG: hypothetical protein K2M34_01265 [Alphaproteobacteria bacterium]|nr:hypothetical protein [Alphaproteobacteria bacterium]
MFHGEFNFDLYDALDSALHFQHPEYSGTYHTTNEPITNWVQSGIVDNPRVLTVAASGDQPLMYASAGASQVDTFDITVYACMVMDFKTSASQSMNYSQYMTTVQKLCNLETLELNAPVVQAINNMPQRTRALMYNAKMYRPNALSKHDIKKLSFPTDPQTYAKIQASVHTPFNFIWADLENVSHYITGKYDIINISNIFDHYLWFKESLESIYDTIQKLWSHLNVGGHILCTTVNFAAVPFLNEIPQRLPNLHANVLLTDESPNNLWQAILIQKTR